MEEHVIKYLEKLIEGIQDGSLQVTDFTYDHSVEFRIGQPGTMHGNIRWIEVRN